MNGFHVIRILCVLLSLCGVIGAPASAQQWPAKPVRFIVPFPPGQAADIATRLLAEPLTVALGQQVVVENRPGAGTMIGTQMVAKSPPDGYTILAGGSSALVIGPHVYKNTGYDTLRDFAPITKINVTPFVFCVNLSLPVRSIPELVAMATRRPGEINYGSPGSGTTSHLTLALFEAAAKVTLTHVPYKGGAVASITDLIGGQISLIAETPLAVLPLVKAGKMRAIGVSSAARISFLPDVATLQEQGIKDFEVTG
jgi:tripartite-type tricarboxylate transporter receptor subunit TctC